MYSLPLLKPHCTSSIVPSLSYVMLMISIVPIHLPITHKDWYLMSFSTAEQWKYCTTHVLKYIFCNLYHHFSTQLAALPCIRHLCCLLNLLSNVRTSNIDCWHLWPPPTRLHIPLISRSFIYRFFFAQPPIPPIMSVAQCFMLQTLYCLVFFFVAVLGHQGLGCCYNS